MDYLKNDQDWLEMISNPDKYQKDTPFSLPTIIDDSKQIRYTGKAGNDNFNQAFNFYQYVLSKCDFATKNPKVMDFGAGWGRIIRFFLRNTKEENLFAVDVMEEAVGLIKGTGFKGNVIKCNPLPPVKEIKKNDIDLIYAFSVFSHLKEEYFIEWMKFFRTIVSKDGYVVFTSRGLPFLHYMKTLKDTKPESEWPNYLKKMGDLDDVKSRYDNGEFIFYPSAGGDELSSDFFGEAYIPGAYLKKVAKDLKFEVVSETYTIKNISQHVFILKPI